MKSGVRETQRNVATHPLARPVARTGEGKWVDEGGLGCLPWGQENFPDSSPQPLHLVNKPAGMVPVRGRSFLSNPHLEHLVMSGFGSRAGSGLVHNRKGLHPPLKELPGSSGGGWLREDPARTPEPGWGGICSPGRESHWEPSLAIKLTGWCWKATRRAGRSLLGPLWA